MLTKIFNATSRPSPSKGSSAGRADRDASGKKPVPKEFSGDEASGFLAAMLQAAVAVGPASQAAAMSSGFGKDDAMSGGAAEEPESTPGEENADAALPDIQVSPESAPEHTPAIDPDAEDAGPPGGVGGTRTSSDPGGTEALADRVAGMPLRKRPAVPFDAARTALFGMTASSEGRGAGQRGLLASGPDPALSAMEARDPSRHEDLDAFSGIRRREGDLDGEDTDAVSNSYPAGAADGPVPDTTGPFGDIAAPRTSTPAEVLDQVVAHARLTARGGAPEIEILLQPESMGDLRIWVSTDKRQVTVRILAEQASAAEIMEDHAAQLKSDLQAAGFEMAHFEVSVARDVLDSGTEGHALAPSDPRGDSAVADAPAGENGAKGVAVPAGDGFAPMGRIDFFA